MASIRKLKPTTPGQRHRIAPTFDEITTDKPYKPLLEPIKRTGGRNADGRRSMRYIGGGHKRRYRVIDFIRAKHDVPATVLTVEYDPNRTANIALIHYADGEKRYIIAPKGLKVGMEIISGPKQDIKLGNCLPLSDIPMGTMVHNIELKPGKGAQLVRSAGASAQVLGKEERYIIIRLTSGEVRKILSTCRATIGEVGNESHELVKIGKAGRARWMGQRDPAHEYRCG